MKPFLTQFAVTPTDFSSEFPQTYDILTETLTEAPGSLLPPITLTGSTFTKADADTTSDESSDR